MDRKDEDELEEENDDTNLDFNDKSEHAYSNVSSHFSTFDATGIGKKDPFGNACWN